jgi:molecular chaperone GrpE
MNRGKEKKEKSREDSQVEIEVTQEGAPDKKDHEAKEKSLEKSSKAELIEKVKKLEEESKNNYDLFLRSEADSENMKKRSKKEKEEWIRYANEKIVKDLLPVLDNLENAISHSKNEGSLDALREGVELTLKGMKDTLIKSGLEEVKAQDESFDPCYHHAVSEQEDEKVKAGVICHELQKGYTFNQRLIRPAMVVVSKGKPGGGAPPDDPS